MDELVGLLSRERLLLERLLFRVTELRHLLVAGDARFLSWAAEDVDKATALVRDAELRRAVVVETLAAEMGVEQEELSLFHLVETSEEPYTSILAETRSELLRLASEVKGALATCRTLALTGQDSVQEVLDRITGMTSDQAPLHKPSSTTYGPGGGWSPEAGPRVVRSL